MSAAAAAFMPSFVSFDEEDFGEFEFAAVPASGSPPAPAPPDSSRSNQLQWHKAAGDEDSDWGDFVESPLPTQPLGSLATLPPSCSFFDSFHESLASTPDLASVHHAQPLRADTGWQKPSGALPLSLFGEEDDEDGAVVESANSFDSQVSVIQGGASASFKSAGGSVVPSVQGEGLKDLIASLYSHADVIGSSSAGIHNRCDENVRVHTSTEAKSDFPDGVITEEDQLKKNSWEFNYALGTPLEDPTNGLLVKKENQLSDECRAEVKTTDSQCGFQANGQKCNDILEANLPTSVESDEEWETAFISHNATNHGFGAISAANGYHGSSTIAPCDLENGKTGLNPNMISEDMGLGGSFWEFKNVSLTPKTMKHFVEPEKPKTEEDDEWSDFVESSLQHQPFNSTELLLESSSDLFSGSSANVPVLEAKYPAPQVVLDGGWQKPSGALPLSLFGKEDNKSKVEDESSDLLNPHLSRVEVDMFASFESTRSNSAVSMKGEGLKELITSLYREADKVDPNNCGDFGSGDNLKVSSVDGVKSNIVNEVPDCHDEHDESDWQFKGTLLSSTHVGSYSDHVEAEKETELTGIPQNEGVMSIDTELQSAVHSGFNRPENSHTPTCSNGSQKDSGDSYLIIEGHQYGPDSIFCSTENGKPCSVGHCDLVSTTFNISTSKPSNLSSQDSASPNDGLQEKGRIIDFYSRLKQRSYTLALHHMKSIKRTNGGKISGEQPKLGHSDGDMKAMFLNLGIVATENNHLEESPCDLAVNDLLEALLNPCCHPFDMEYGLSSKIQLAAKELTSGLSLYEHASNILHILTLVSLEEQHAYIISWSKLVLACEKELQHGAAIWSKAYDANIQKELLYGFRGQQYFLALGEIYRVVELLSASAKLYKAWLLMNPGGSSVFLNCIKKSMDVWKDSSLKQALEIISESYGELKTVAEKLLESLIFISELSTETLQSHLLSHETRFCRLSLLPFDLLPDMKDVVWHGDHYFSKVAIFWANRVSCDAPELPLMHVDQGQEI